MDKLNKVESVLKMVADFIVAVVCAIQIIVRNDKVQPTAA